MCVVNSDKGNYEFIITSLDDNPIISFRISSITNVCRILDQFDFNEANVSVVRLKDNLILDNELLLDIWRSK